MNTNILVTANGLSDRDLLARLDALAGRERAASAALVAHLAALDSRPSLYAAEGYGSLFSYCTQALRLSEDAACSRIEAARACRRFPVILDRLASGELTLTAVRLLGRHLTPETHQAVLARAARRSRSQIEALVAELAPQPDAPTSVRKLPTLPVAAPSSTPASRAPSVPPVAPPPAAFAPVPRPIVQPTAPERYRVQFTIGEQTHEKLRRLQALFRREIPDGDPGAIFDRAITLLLEKVEKKKLGATAKPRLPASIRPRTDKRRPDLPSAYVPPAVKRVAWQHDGGQCGYIAPSGRRCTDRTFLEFHHAQARAKQGPATVANIRLRCWRHNQYEAELVFGPGRRRSRDGTPPRH